MRLIDLRRLSARKSSTSSSSGVTRWTLRGSLIAEDADGPICTVKFSRAWQDTPKPERLAAVIAAVLRPSLDDPQERAWLRWLLNL
jgi:hypothetical protein